MLQLLELLDLQQKEANLYEAQTSNLQTRLATRQAKASREQADETKAQSQIILLFTVVTIIFVCMHYMVVEFFHAN